MSREEHIRALFERAFVDITEILGNLREQVLGLQNVEPPPSFDQPEPEAPVVDVYSVNELNEKLRTAAPGTVFRLPRGNFSVPIIVPALYWDPPVTITGHGDETVLRSSPGSPAIAVYEPGSGGVIFSNFRVTASGYHNTAYVWFGTIRPTSSSDLPRDLVLRDMTIVAPPDGGLRGLLLNCGRALVDGCTITGFKSESEAQAVASWNATGPHVIRNSRLSGAGQCVFYGDSSAALGRNPSDILIENCELFKSDDMQEKRPDGRPRWMLKNIFQLKRAENVTVRNCVLRNSFPGPHNGVAFSFTVRCTGGAPWAAVRNVLVENCRVEKCGAGVVILGRDDNAGYGGTLENIVIRNTSFEIVRNMGSGRVFSVFTGAKRVRIENCEVFGNPSHALVLASPLGPDQNALYPVEDLTVTGNRLRGIVHGDGAPWASAFRRYVRGLHWENNVWTDGTPVPPNFPGLR